jgi:phosphatidylserine/phosphatidylglycerophosphate/cardiolipin synthase-like enzyme
MRCRTLIRSRRSAAALLVLVALLSGCTISPPRYEKGVELSPRARADTAISCPDDSPRRCAILSPIAELADRAFAADTHFVTILDVGREALEIRLHLIRSARQSIDLQTYIWANDESGQLMMRELVAAARRGVRIRLLSDQLRDGMTAEYLARLAITHENLEKRIYNPFLGDAIMADTDYLWGMFFHFDVLNHRMHCKLMVVDGRVAIVGGRNVQNRYFDLDPEFDYIDRDILVTGPVVQTMQSSFDDYWNSPIVTSLDQLADVRERLFEDGEPASLQPLASANEQDPGRIAELAIDPDYIRATFVENAFQTDRIVFTADRPMKPFVKEAATDLNTSATLREVVGNMKQSLVVQTPYPILSGSAYKMLRRLRKRNPEAEFTVSTNSLATADHYYVYALAFKRKKRNIKKLGFNIFELKNKPADIEQFIPRYAELAADGPDRLPETNDYRAEPAAGDELLDIFSNGTPTPRISIHAKSLVIDGQVAVIGSHNFDPRSRDINTENAVIIWDEAFASALAARIRLATQPQNSWLIARSEEVPIIGYFTEMIGSVSRILPVFDLWPFRWASSFELRPGMTPVPRDHPDFYRRYADLGQFPTMGMDVEQLQVQLVSGFGAVAEPFM